LVFKTPSKITALSQQ